MAINLDKSAIEKQYYYEENGNTYGPFSLSILLIKIKSNTLVYREGIEWTEAKEIDELKHYFKVEKVIEKHEPSQQTNIAAPIVEVKKSNNGGLWFFIILVIVAGVGYYFYNQNNTISSEKTTSIDSSKVVANTLSGFEIFDLQAIQNYKPTEEQKNIALNLLEEANLAMENQDYTEAITKYKESLKNDPQAQTYFLLSNAYLKNYDFSRSEQCLKLAGNLDYQPKSELDYKLISIYAAQGNYELLNEKILEFSTSNVSLLQEIETDTNFYSYRNSPFYLNIIEKDISFELIGEDSKYSIIIQGYFESINNRSINAHDFFNENVIQYYNKKNTNPDEINEIVNSNKEFVNPQCIILGSKLFITGANSRQVWLSFSCYRTSKKKYQTCRVKAEFNFNDFQKITSYKEIEIKDLKYTI